ncbi:MAG: fasciclin domain-containing protein [Deltaproteobacteria bacterium]|nr:fasciclin domain-containing protein [Deltaproteobacteria bacterium]
MKDIFETLQTDDSFRTLVDAVKNAGLVETLKEAGPFTLFAADNDAFTKLSLDDILADSKLLKETLLYHLVEGKLSEEDLRTVDCSPTVNGKTLAIRVRHGVVVVDNGNVTTTDIECSNGVIHVIDSVFKPSLSGWYGDCGCC